MTDLYELRAAGEAVFMAHLGAMSALLGGDPTSAALRCAIEGAAVMWWGYCVVAVWQGPVPAGVVVIRRVGGAVPAMMSAMDLRRGEAHLVSPEEEALWRSAMPPPSVEPPITVTVPIPRCLGVALGQVLRGGSVLRGES